MRFIGGWQCSHRGYPKGPRSHDAISAARPVRFEQRTRSSPPAAVHRTVRALCAIASAASSTPASVGGRRPRNQPFSSQGDGIFRESRTRSVVGLDPSRRRKSRWYGVTIRPPRRRETSSPDTIIVRNEPLGLSIDCEIATAHWHGERIDYDHALMVSMASRDSGDTRPEAGPTVGDWNPS